jgi:hypothetical protein
MIQTKKTITGTARKQPRFIINNLFPINSITSYLSTTPEQEFAKVSDKFSTLEANAQKQDAEKGICGSACRGKGRAIEITNDAWG